MQLATANKCTGCMACMTDCPRSAISVEQNVLGDFYPKIDENACIQCGRCEKVCPELHPLPTKTPYQAFAAWSLDPENRKSSTSGGMAATLYQRALEKGWWICGTEYLPDGRVTHTLTQDSAAIGRYKKSKYVFSETGNIYPEIKKLLDAGQKVLMISLPCKIAGLFGFLKKPYDNLFTVDIVCHGTPSGKLLTDHIQAVKPGLENFRLTFREDNAYRFMLVSDGKVRYCKTGRTDTYLAAFMDGLSYRESCYHCTYAKNQRISDMTICDFWGLGKEIPFNHPYTGAISAVLLNTDRGEELFRDCKELLFTEERPVSEAIQGNAQLNAPTPVHPRRNAFVQLHQQKGFEAAVQTLLRSEMKNEKNQVRRRQIRMSIRRLAGVFIKRYRG